MDPLVRPGDLLQAICYERFVIRRALCAFTQRAYAPVLVAHQDIGGIARKNTVVQHARYILDDRPQPFRIFYASLEKCVEDVKRLIRADRRSAWVCTQCGRGPEASQCLHDGMHRKRHHFHGHRKRSA